MVFYSTPASAQQAGFRACKRCAPDAVPGSPEWNRRDDLVARAVRAIEDGHLDRNGVSGVAASLGVSSRHLTRVMQQQLGAGPLALARSRRARAARILIETTAMPFSDVAFASGFESVRQFNDTVKEVFASTPTGLRSKRGVAKQTLGEPGWISLKLSFRPPLDVAQLFGWLGSHRVAGLEELTSDGAFRTSMRLANGAVVAEVAPAENYIQARFRMDSMSDLQQAVQRVRGLLDLDADPLVIGESLSNSDPVLAELVASAPGLRSPAAVSGFDAAVRAVLHQQVSVQSATAVAARLVAAHGEVLHHPVGEVTHLMPTPPDWAAMNPSDLGLPKARATALVTLAKAVADGSLDLGPSANRDQARKELGRLKGIGPWTQAIISLRGLRDPDVFCAGDLALRRVAGSLNLPNEAKALDNRSQEWAPWRSYAMHQLWNRYGDWKKS